MKVLVAMSGGVDSSVAAALLQEAGHEVVGATLKLWGGASDSGCCSVADVDDARRVAQTLGIDHHVFNYTEEFEAHVVAPFVRDHARAMSPNPCIECNRHIKFDLLVERARRLGFAAVATGHHARVTWREGVAHLTRGVDRAKDQSYVLGYLQRDRLEQLMLPIGALTKDEVRAHALRLGLRTWDKPDSQDVCFIEASKGREAFLRSRMELTAAQLVDRESGEVVGHTDAAELMTVGQRRGVVPGRDGVRRFVARVDLGARRVEVGRLQDVMVTRLALSSASVTFAGEALGDGAGVWAQWSAHGQPRRATLRHGDDWSLELFEPARPVAAGQTVVFYSLADETVVEGAALVGR
ncbi:MAG: tRNA 2-thiouridine(34) synthase MnmA [Acidobacteriota bacterium]|nr:tRNA 2-thiouridine(34) synthase MnmA [Acidobacteriota bacterium]MDE3093268.1 tRNA 2-thiouridine(34) synthase MnmA [Acidobacteriota bacterium]